MNVYTLNNEGIQAINDFVKEVGKDGLNAEVWYELAEDNASNFDAQLDCVIEVGSLNSWDGRPHTLTMQPEHFDVEVIED